MRTILVANAKGGSGKSTIATNLASYFACWGIRVTLVDFDRQGSALDWLRARPADRPAIAGVESSAGRYEAPATSDYVVVDVPAGLHGEELARCLALAESVIVPVLPSPMDIRASGRFVGELLSSPGFRRGRTRVCAVANRVRRNTNSYRHLEAFLVRLGIPFIGRLRDTQNYVHAAAAGLGIFELPPRRVAQDLGEWQPLVGWLTLDERLGVIPPIAPAAI